MNLEKTKKAYEEIFSAIDKHRDIITFDYNDLLCKSKIHLFAIELKEKYGLNIEPQNIRSLDWNRFGDYLSIGLFGEKYKRIISWPDDGKQPEDEVLIHLSFPTGAYIFGNDYPTELFKQFWQELKAYNPKYYDTVNNSLYFSMENGAKIFNEFQGILEKYYELNEEDLKKRKIKKLQDELEKLNKES